jgi:Haem-NO-binding
MYGLVNKSIQELITRQFGAVKWEAIRRDAGVDVEVFVGMEAYPDEITYRLVESASRILDVRPDELLEAFGEHWVEDTGRQGYGDLMNIGGKTFVGFLSELDNMHSRIALLFPKLRPPSFECSDIERTSVRLHYYSTRVGLAPMIFGLVRGLGRLFQLWDVKTEHLVRRDDGADHDEFVIRWSEP